MNFREREHIADLAQLGLNPSQIAIRLKHTRATVYTHMITHGLWRLSGKIGKPYKRSSGEVFPFTPDEDAFVETLRVEGCTYREIAERVLRRFERRRAPSTIGVRLKMLASHSLFADEISSKGSTDGIAG